MICPFRWAYISLPYATFAVELKGDHVAEAAPIARWMIGKSLEFVSMWVKSKQGYMILR